MSQHAYPSSAMIGDYARAAAGLVPSAAILATMPLASPAAAVLAALTALFGVFGVRTALRHGTRLELNETGLVASGPLSTSIPWAELSGMKLAYYSTRRDRKAGWMQLELRAGRSRVRLDSRIEGFAQVVERAAAAAQARDLALSAATATNLEALGRGAV
ncbi:MAG TPA: hypothetical protein VFQ82_06055 [Stellaceae bacterium]|jgi:hypothetical protein|nr:hypothetical protein [Stellaceae bacterium]